MSSAPLRGDLQEAREDNRQLSYKLAYNIYSHHIASAHQKWLANDVAGAERLLYFCPQEFRHWEWGYLKPALPFWS